MTSSILPGREIRGIHGIDETDHLLGAVLSVINAGSQNHLLDGNLLSRSGRTRV